MTQTEALLMGVLLTFGVSNAVACQMPEADSARARIEKVSRPMVWQPGPDGKQVPLWPDSLAIQRPASDKPEEVGNGSRLVAGRPWHWAGNVSRPTMTIYQPTGRNTRAAMLVLPGGGYQAVAMDLEGTEICDWVTRQGMTCIVLKYRVPQSWFHGEERAYRPPVVQLPLQDAQRAMGQLRHRASSHGIDPRRIGVIGFSAGAHLASAVSNAEKRTYEEVDAADRESSIPDFAILLYPGRHWASGSREPGLHVAPWVEISASAPPTLLIHAMDDATNDVRHSMAYGLALKEAGVSVDMRFYATGGHAFGMRPTRDPITTEWPELVVRWLKHIGLERRGDRRVDARALAFVGGRWFNGASFEARTAYSVNGTLTFARPATVDSTLDLAGGYVIPPFGEAHNHNVEHSARIDATIAQYLADGVFYVKNPNNLPRTRAALAGKVNVPAGIDVAFANGGLTAPGGHPVPHVAFNIGRGVWTEADGEAAFYFTVADKAELDRKWPAVLAGRPDFIKTFLLHSEEYEQRRDSSFAGWKGLDPALLPEIVRRAHAAGLRVSTHVETATDFHNALIAGVDEISHMPGFRGNPDVQLPDRSVYEIVEADARLAAQRGTVVVSTLGGIRELELTGPDSLRRRSFDRLHARNLRLLRAHGVRLALGSDDYGDTSVGEAMYLHGLGVMDNLALIKLWAEATPQAIFPGRRVGCLRDGCEASFLVLRGNPLADFRHVRDIALRVKQGNVFPDAAVKSR